LIYLDEDEDEDLLRRLGDLDGDLLLLRTGDFLSGDLFSGDFLSSPRRTGEREDEEEELERER